MGDTSTTARKERRRRRAAEEKAADKKAEKDIENVEPVIESQSSDKLFRRDTYVLSKSKSDVNVIYLAEKPAENLNVSSMGEGSSSDASVRTYNIQRKSDQGTYNVINEQGSKGIRPIPAPRRTKSSVLSVEKVSSDTDRDVTELDLDDLSARNKSDTDSKSVKFKKPSSVDVKSGSDESIVMPVPKPRKRIQVSRSEEKSISMLPLEYVEGSTETQKEKNKPEEDEKEEGLDEEEQKPGGPPTAEFPILEPIAGYALKSESEINENLKKEKKLKMIDLIEKKETGKKAKKNKSGKIFSSIMKLDKGKIPKIASLIKDLNESEKRDDVRREDEGEEGETKKGEEGKQEEEEDNADFQIDSPRYPESVQNGQIYVQDKTGFYIMEREDVLKAGRHLDKNPGNDRTMADSTVRTAIFFQKYWSRTMMYFHGILAGFAFGHTAMVTAIIMHFNYDPKGFIDIYSRLSLKIHYIFYSLTTFCIVSCFDRIDIGHINRKHWTTTWRVPSMWAVMFIYIISFGLTFANLKTQARFDAYSYTYGNDTDEKIWSTKVPGEIQVGFLTWFHTVWARDILLLIAWFVISLTKFSDFLSGHLKNMMKYSDLTIDGKL